MRVPQSRRRAVVFLTCGPAASHSPALPASKHRSRAGLSTAMTPTRRRRDRQHSVTT
nr:MAG TPA: hypothetical protein [Caudoviricetes sp.]